jgi:uncharacterized pyridoxamine 5'-phosphate oxidase family protein
MGTLVVAETPPRANNNNAYMSLAGLPTSQKAGENVDYYMVVSNPSSTLPDISADAKDITVTFYPAQADGTPSASGTVVRSIAYLAVDAAPVIIGSVPYPMPYLNPGVTAAVSRAVLNGTILLGSGGGQPFSIVKQVSIDLIGWTIDKTVTDVGGHGLAGSVDKAGDTISYKVVISNTGDVLLQGNLTDSLPGTYDMSGPAESGGTVAGWLEPGENWTYTYKYNAKQSDIDANGINKNGVADGDGDIDNEAIFTDNHANSKSDIEDVPILQDINWTIDKMITDVGGDGPTGSVDKAGDIITYQVVITNTGGVSLQGSLVDSLPWIYDMSGPAESGGTIAGWLEPGENWTYTYSYNAKQSDIDNNGINKNGVADGDGDIDNEATFTDNHANSKSDIEDVPIQEIGWTIDKTVTDVGGDGPTGSVDEAGDTISYQVVISNTGDVLLQGNLTDSLPGIYDMSGPVESGGTVAGWLEPGENWTYTYKYNAKQSDIDNNGINKNGVADNDGDIDNEATFTDNSANSESDIEDVPILQDINWTIDKTVIDVGGDGPTGSVGKAGDTISYKVVISNTGDTSLQGSLVDSLPGIYDMSGPTESGGTIAGWLEPGENWTYTYKYNAKQSDIDANGINKNGVADGDGDIDNEATFRDNHANSKSDIEDVPIQEIGWTIDKTVTDVGGDGPAGSVDKAGDTMSYQVVITNTGDAPLQGNLTDSLPGIYDMSGPVESGGTVAGWLEPGETWTYTYSYSVKQSDIDNNGINKNGAADGDGDIDNEATFRDSHANSQFDIQDVRIRQQLPVGWETYPINKVRVLIPWIALLAAIIVGASLLVLRRRRA